MGTCSVGKVHASDSWEMGVRFALVALDPKGPGIEDLGRISRLPDRHRGRGLLAIVRTFGRYAKLFLWHQELFLDPDFPT